MVKLRRITLGEGHGSRAFYRLVRKKIAVSCILIIALIYLAGLFAPFLAPYEYDQQDYTAVRKAPSLQHWAGTDLKGRDVFSRVIWGVQNTVIITIVTMGTGGIVLGVSLGLLSGYYGGKIDSIIMRIGELFF